MKEAFAPPSRQECMRWGRHPEWMQEGVSCVGGRVHGLARREVYYPTTAQLPHARRSGGVPAAALRLSLCTPTRALHPIPFPCQQVKSCTKIRPHDWCSCPYSHPGEKAKRWVPLLCLPASLAGSRPCIRCLQLQLVQPPQPTRLLARPLCSPHAGGTHSCMRTPAQPAPSSDA